MGFWWGFDKPDPYVVDLTGKKRGDTIKLTIKCTLRWSNLDYEYPSFDRVEINTLKVSLTSRFSKTYNINKTFYSGSGVQSVTAEISFYVTDDFMDRYRTDLPLAMPGVEYVLYPYTENVYVYYINGSSFEKVGVEGSLTIKFKGELQKETVTWHVFVAKGNGSVSPSGDVTIKEPNSLTVTATPDSGWKFKYWKVAKNPGDVGPIYYDNPLTLSWETLKVTTPKYLGAYFEEIAPPPPPPPETVTVTVRSEKGGTITVYYEDIDGSKQDTIPEDWAKMLRVVKGSTLTVHASPKSGYKFNYWTYNGTKDYDTELSLNIFSDLTITAYFKEVEVPPPPPPPPPPTQYNLTITVGIGGYVTGYISGEQIIVHEGESKTYTVEEGSSVTLTAHPISGYVLDKWIYDSSTSGANPITITITRNISAKAVFNQTQPQICQEGDEKCVGVDLYRCIDGGWVLVEKNSEKCGWTPPPSEVSWSTLLPIAILGAAGVVIIYELLK